MIFWLAVAGSGLMAVASPRLGALQATGAIAFAPVSHPASRFAGLLMADPGPIQRPGELPAKLSEALDENQRLRQRIEQLHGQLEVLKSLNEDRKRLGESVLPHCTPARVIGAAGDVLQIVVTGQGPIAADAPALHYGPVHHGVAGVVSAAGAAGAQVRLISDPSIRIEGRFGRIDQQSGELRVLDIEPPLVEGAGGGMCQIARAKREELDRERVAAGDWVVLADRNWPEELLFYRIGQVASIEDIAAEPGFARVMIRPAVELRALSELMVFRTQTRPARP